MTPDAKPADVLCRACGYSGSIDTYKTSLAMYSDCRCPKCGSTDNQHNSEYMERIQQAFRRADKAKKDAVANTAQQPATPAHGSLDHLRACAEDRRKKIAEGTMVLRIWVNRVFDCGSETTLSELERMVSKIRADVDQIGCDAVATSVAETPVSMRLLSNVVFYIIDQSKEFRQCACHHSRHNPGAEAVAYRAAEILKRIAADIEAAKAAM